MKKVLKSLVLILVVSLTFILTSCSKEEKQTYKTEETTYAAALVDSSLQKEGYTLIGLLSTNQTSIDNLPAGTYNTLYQLGSTIPAGEYYPVYVENSAIGEDGKFSYPEVELKSLNFSGYYTADGKRVATTNAAEVLYARYISFGQAGLVVVVCILIVFAMLALLWGIVSLFKFIAPKPKKEKEQVKEEATPVSQTKQGIKLEDIKDDDMMVAALIATIDYHDEIKKDVRVVSIKEVK